MRLIGVILGLLLGILALLGTLLAMGGVEGAGAHPSIEGMSVGGDGLARLGGAGWMIFLLQTLTLLLIYALIALGVPARHRSRRFWILLGIGCAISLAVWWGMYGTYRHYLETGDVRMLLGFPLPTTLMLFGVFLGGSLLCGLYIWGFRRFVLTDEDEAAYEALRAQSANPRKPDARSAGSEP